VAETAGVQLQARSLLCLAVLLGRVVGAAAVGLERRANRHERVVLVDTRHRLDHFLPAAVRVAREGNAPAADGDAAVLLPGEEVGRDGYRRHEGALLVVVLVLEEPPQREAVLLAAGLHHASLGGGRALRRRVRGARGRGARAVLVAVAQLACPDARLLHLLRVGQHVVRGCGLGRGHSGRVVLLPGAAREQRRHAWRGLRGLIETLPVTE